MTIGERLRRLRMEHSLGQKEVANILGISLSGYSSYENDIRNLTIKNVVKLAKFYNVTTDYILGVEENRHLSVKDVSRRVQDLEKQIIEFKQYLSNCK